MVRRALPAGDYSLAGHETEVAVERKSLADLLGTLTRGRRRFKAELKRLATYRFAAVVVEANFRDALTGNYNSQLKPNALIGSVMSITLDHGIPVFWLGDRQAAVAFTEWYLARCHEILKREGTSNE
ncbi:ERCC4 domain-containing protein [Sulfidibacter corallicola]